MAPSSACSSSMLCGEGRSVVPGAFIGHPSVQSLAEKPHPIRQWKSGGLLQPAVDELSVLEADRSHNEGQPHGANGVVEHACTLSEQLGVFLRLPARRGRHGAAPGPDGTEVTL